MILLNNLQNEKGGAKMKILLMAVLMCGFVSPVFASHNVNRVQVQFRSPVQIQRVQRVQVQKVQKVQVQNIIVEKQIPLFDTILGVQHNQYQRIQPSNKTLEIRRIEQVISPQQFLIERQEYQPVVVERVVVPQKVVVLERVQSYRNYCR